MSERFHNKGLIAIDDITDFAVESLDDFHMNYQGMLNTKSSYEDRDYHYELSLTMIRSEKHSCKDCSYFIDEKCNYDEKVSLSKKYCVHFTDEHKCYECKHFQTWGGDDYTCKISKNWKYCIDYNRNDECEDWELNHDI